MKLNKARSRLLIAWLLVMFFATSCSVRKFVPKDEYLLKSAQVELLSDKDQEDIGALKNELDGLLRPSPNTMALGPRLGLLVHYKAQREKPGFLNKYLNKKIGEAPVYLSDVDISRTIDLIQNRLENNGFFYSEISSSIAEKKKLAEISYRIDLGRPYRLEKYALDSGGVAIYQEIERSLSETKLKPGKRFNLDALKEERERIDAYLKSNGYYNFNADFLIFEADTNQYKTRKYDLFLRLKKDVPQKSLMPYVLNEINVYPDYSLNDEGVESDTTHLNGINFIQNPVFFRPKRMAPYILFKKGQHYDPQKSRLTSSRLSSIGAYKYVNIRYEPAGTNEAGDSLRLNANIFLSPLKKRSLRAELQAVTKSNGFAGPTLAGVYSNRNQFKGGETLNITGSLGYEVQIGGDNTNGLSSTQVGLKADLIFPRLLIPFRVSDSFLYSVPRTKVSVGFDLFNRSNFYSLNSLNATFGYSWRTNRSIFHEINPISLSYLNTSNITDEFQAILDQNPFLESSFRQQLITGLTYTFVYNQLTNPEKRNPILTVFNFDIAGNLLEWTGSTKNENGQKTLFDIAYAQYVKADINFIYNYKLSNEHRLVTRIFGGIGIPYGNSESLPFAKQYFAGGPSSVRAFRTRSLGPGTYNPNDTDQGSFFDRSGDIRLEANVEYRFPIYSYIKGAVFFDAGNVWLTRENTALPGGKFSSSFLEELGTGMGIGFRVDVQNFVIRLDLASPLSRPYLPKGSRFDLDLKELLLNFAIGYPF